MHIFVISLPDAVSRREAITRQLRDLGLPYEIYPAIRGKDLSPDERKMHYDEKKFIRNVGMPASAGEIGCALSHLSVWRLVTERKLSHALILEDDAWLNPNLPQLLDALEEKVPPEQKDVILLTWTARTARKLSDKIWSSYRTTDIRNAVCAHGYVVTHAAAASLAKALYPIQQVPDPWNWVRRHGFANLKAVIPPVITNDLSTNSSVATSVTEKHLIVDRSGLKLVVHKFRRAWWILIDRVMAVKDRWIAGG